MKIINFEKKKLIPLTNERKDSHEKAKISYTCTKMLQTCKNINTLAIKIIIKLQTIVTRLTVNTEMLQVAFVI